MVDLHLHTNYSDGTDTLKELLVNAEDNKLEVISITDHDTIDAYFELENPNIRSIFSGKIIPGVELKTFYNGIPMEILGYGIDYKRINIPKIDTYSIQLASIEELKRRAKKLNLIFDENITVSKTDPKRKYAALTLARELLKYDDNKDILLSIGPEFQDVTFYRVHVSNKNSIFYYDESKFVLGFQETIDIVHKAGGKAILAHPLLYPYELDKFVEIETMIKNYALDGLECEYPLFSKEERNILKGIALKYNKIVTGGTDYHAKHKPNVKMGSGINNNICINNDYISKLLNNVKTL